MTNAPPPEGPEAVGSHEVPLLPPGWSKTTSVTTETVPGREGLKQGTAGPFVVFSDESAEYGGQGEWPSPLNYAALAIGW